jgi:hypothetical protein
MKDLFDKFGKGICDPLCKENRTWVAAVVAIIVVLIIVGLLVFFLVYKKKKSPFSSDGGNFATGSRNPLGFKSINSQPTLENTSTDRYLQGSGLYPSRKESMTGWREGPVFSAPVDAPEMESLPIAEPAAEGFAGSSAIYPREDELSHLIRY